MIYHFQFSRFIIIIFILFTGSQAIGQNANDLTCEFLQTLKSGNDAGHFIQEIEDLKFEDLLAELDSEDKKLTFWINTYNAFVIYKLLDDPSSYDNRSAFFGEEDMLIAGNIFSFDAIEHGIIRSSKSKFTLGLTGKLFVDDLEKKLRLKSTDPRIHFALNCGANSCPPVDIYYPETLHQQLDRNAQTYLQSTTSYNETENELQVTVLMSWFRGDFDGYDGIIKMLQNYSVIASDISPDLEYADYDWTINVNNFVQ